MFCSSCGKEAMASQNFCDSCGNQLNGLQLAASTDPEKQVSPQSGVSLGLAVAGLLLCLFPILSYPCSITGFVLSRKARAFEEQSYGGSSSRTKAAFALSLTAIVATSLIILISLPYNIERNFG